MFALMQQNIGLDWSLLIRSLLEIAAVLVSAGVVVGTVRTTNQRLADVVTELKEIRSAISDIDKRLGIVEDRQERLRDRIGRSRDED